MHGSTALLPLILVLSALSGCLGFGGDGGNATDDTNNTSGTNNTTTNETGAPPADEGWTVEHKNGTASGVNLVVTEQGGAEETLTVGNGTAVLELTISASGGDLSYCIRKPSTQDTMCEAEGETQSGNATYSATMPEGGTWTVHMSPAMAGPGSVDYSLKIAMQAGEAEASTSTTL